MIRGKRNSLYQTQLIQGQNLRAVFKRLVEVLIAEGTENRGIKDEGRTDLQIVLQTLHLQTEQ